MTSADKGMCIVLVTVLITISLLGIGVIVRGAREDAAMISAGYIWMPDQLVKGHWAMPGKAEK